MRNGRSGHSRGLQVMIQTFGVLHASKHALINDITVLTQLQPAMSSDADALALHKINLHLLTRFIGATVLSYLDRWALSLFVQGPKHICVQRWEACLSAAPI